MIRREDGLEMDPFRDCLDRGLGSDTASQRQSIRAVHGPQRRAPWSHAMDTSVCGEVMPC